MNPLKNILESKYTTGIGIIVLILAGLVLFKVDITPLNGLAELTGIDTGTLVLILGIGVSAIVNFISKDPKKKDKNE